MGAGSTSHAAGKHARPRSSVRVMLEQSKQLGSYAQPAAGYEEVSNAAPAHPHIRTHHQDVSMSRRAGGRGVGADWWLFWLRSVLVLALLLAWLVQALLPALALPRSSTQPQHHGPSAAPPFSAMVLIPGWEKKDDGCALGSARRPHLLQGLARLATTPSVQLGLLLFTALCASTLLFLLFPSNFQCPRWAIRVNILPAPPGTYLDHTAPFFPVPAPSEQLIIVSGANAPFFDRLQNMVGSVQAWAPTQRMALYDLGFLKSQLVEMACWTDVEVRRFDFARYPPHVRDLGNYAFKALVLQEALLLDHAVIWIDAGLELRAPMYTLQSVLSQHGHVGALQEDAIGDAMYTRSKAMVAEMGLTHLWPQASRWQFCAGGLQGFVRGSDATRLILEPVVNCSMRPACISPLDASRLNHNFDQTAFTLAIRANGYTCLPRETHCMWSTKKAARAPLRSSQPIEVISRGHRMPKPYTPLLKRRDHCKPLRQSLVPWARQAPTSFPVWNRYSLGFRLQKVYLQPIGDAIVQAGSCLDVHYVAHILFWGACLMVWLGIGGCKSLYCKWRSASVGQLTLQAVTTALVVGAVQTTLLDVLTRIH